MYLRGKEKEKAWDLHLAGELHKCLLSLAWATLRSGDRKLIQISHIYGKDPSTCAFA